MGNEEERQVMDVNDNIGYWLFYTHRCVGYAFAEVLSKCCKEQNKAYEVTPAQFGVLSTLYAKRGKNDDSMTIGGIAHYRGLDAPTVTGIVKRLEQDGLVRRVHDTGDRRVVKVCLTAESRAILPLMLEAIEAFSAVMLRGFSEADQQDFRAKLHQVINNLSAIGIGVGDRFLLLPENAQEKGKEYYERSHRGASRKNDGAERGS